MPAVWRCIRTLTRSGRPLTFLYFRPSFLSHCAFIFDCRLLCSSCLHQPSSRLPAHAYVALCPERLALSISSGSLLLPSVAWPESRGPVEAWRAIDAAIVLCAARTYSFCLELHLN